MEHSDVCALVVDVVLCFTTIAVERGIEKCGETMVMVASSLMTRKLPSSLMKIQDSSSRSMKETVSKMEAHTYNVFLGGSCGGRKSPTTWRKEVAIPLLTKNDITFFNPQVDTWTNDLIHKENEAKENSDWLLFMLESSTRGIVSLVEVAYLVGSGRSVIFVLQEERERGQLCIKEDSVTTLEKDDIVQSQQTLNSIISRHQHCRYFSVLEKGLHHVIDGLKQNDTVQSHGNSYSAKGGKKCQDWIQKLSTMFIRSQKPCEGNQKKNRPGHLTLFNPFQKYMLGIITVDGASQIVQTTLDRLKSSRITLPRESIYVAHENGTDVTDSLMQCSAILVVIPENSLGCAAMCKAAYMLSKTKNIVMCVQDINADMVDNGNTSLTSSAMDDFNRARAYLRDMASQQNVPVYSSVDDSVSLVTQKLKRRTSIFYQVITED